MNRTSLTDEACRVISNNQVGPALYLIELEAPRTASTILPGQFVHIQIPEMPDHLLRRPFSVYNVSDDATRMQILYQVVGYGTEVLTRIAEGATIQSIGPVGNGWSVPEANNVVLVGGGVGAAPLFMFAKACAQAGKSVVVVLGAQTKDALVTYNDYCALPNVEVVSATDDGSFGHAGFCTAPAGEAIEQHAQYVACCGPEPLMKIVSNMAIDAKIPCSVSLERRMACGVGACLSCVVDTVDGKKRACVDGPVFDATKVVW